MGTWQTSAAVQTVVAYVQDFRKAHSKSFTAGKSFVGNDPNLGTMCQFILGELIYTPEFTGAWVELQDPEVAQGAANCVRGLRLRLEDYKRRKGVDDD